MIQIDISMPKTCYECPCHNGENGSCQITGKYYFDEIPKSCPLKEVETAELQKNSSKELPRWIFHKSGDEDDLVWSLMSPGDYYSCPICFNSSNVMYNYCPSCGEKLGRANYGGENK